MARLSLQLYTLRDLFDSDRDATFAAIASMGLDEVEPFGIEHFDWLPGTLAEHGLSAGSAHADVIGAPDQVLLELEAVAVAVGDGAQDVDRGSGDLRADAVTGQDDDVSVHG